MITFETGHRTSDSDHPVRVASYHIRLSFLHCELSSWSSKDMMFFQDAELFVKREVARKWSDSSRGVLSALPRSTTSYLPLLRFQLHKLLYSSGWGYQCLPVESFAKLPTPESITCRFRILNETDLISNVNSCYIIVLQPSCRIVSGNSSFRPIREGPSVVPPRGQIVFLVIFQNCII